MKAQRRKILLLLDNVPCHPTQFDFSNVELCYLPPNTTAAVQPLDQGTIRAFKIYYRGLMMHNLL